MKKPAILALALTSLIQPLMMAQQQDAPPVDLNQLVQALKALKDQQVVQTKSAKQKAMQEAQSAAGSGAAAVMAWEEAVRQVQFQGAAREGTQFRDWKEKEGDALSEKEVQNAARLYFVWLHLTLQRSAGATVKDLLPKIIDYTKEVSADAAAIDLLEERIKHEKELGTKRPASAQKRKDDESVKKLHDQILGRNLNGGAPVQAWRIQEFIGVPSWENNPSNVDGIFQNIILPELRSAKDPRLLEYWEMRLKRESEAAAKAKLSFESEKFTQIRRPELLWARAQDEYLLGQKNRALGNMFTLIKTFPAHPQAANWIKTLEQILTPGATPAVGTGGAAPAGTPPENP